MRILAIILALSLSACASTDYDRYAHAQEAIATSRATAETARYDALARIAETGDPQSKIAAVMAIAMGGQGNAQQVQQIAAPVPAGETALRWASVLIPGLTQIYGIQQNARVAINSSNNAAAVAVSTNSTFAGMGNTIGSTAANGNSANVAIAGAGVTALTTVAGAGTAALERLGTSSNTALSALGKSGNDSLAALGASSNTALVKLGESGNNSLVKLGESSNTALTTVAVAGTTALTTVGQAGISGAASAAAAGASGGSAGDSGAGYAALVQVAGMIKGNTTTTNTLSGTGTLGGGSYSTVSTDDHTVTPAPVITPVVQVAPTVITPVVQIVPTVLNPDTVVIQPVIPANQGTL